MSAGIFQDWRANRGNLRSQGVLAFYRLAHACDRLPGGIRWVGWPLRAAYTLVVIWGLGIELHYGASVGRGLRLYHGVGLVVHEKALLGSDCILRNGTTIGMRKGPLDVPVLGDRVDVGSNATLIGGIRIGNDARIGAGAVVVHDVADGDAVAGNPARSLGRQAPRT